MSLDRQIIRLHGLADRIEKELKILPLYGYSREQIDRISELKVKIYTIYTIIEMLELNFYGDKPAGELF